MHDRQHVFCMYAWYPSNLQKPAFAQTAHSVGFSSAHVARPDEDDAGLAATLDAGLAASVRVRVRDAAGRAATVDLLTPLHEAQHILLM